MDDETVAAGRLDRGDETIKKGIIVLVINANPAFHRLLERFGESAPAPLLVNTSFNLFGEPLVITPRDAVRSCFCSGIDALAIGNFTLAK